MERVKGMVADEQVRRFLENPVNFLYSLDWRQQLCHFVPASREAISSLSFLDNRTLGTSQKQGTLPLDQVIRLTSDLPGKCDFIFHSGFCCSTLLARCLDRPNRALSLKEPFSVLNLSGFVRAPAAKTAGADFKTLCQTTLGLLARPFNAGERTLIKPSNGANNLLPSILSEPGCGKVLLLYGPLEDFLVAVITGGQDRQTFIDGILKLFIKDFGSDLKIKDPGTLGPLERAALAWGLQVRLFSEISKTADPSRVMTLNSATFLEDKAKTLSALNDFFDYDFTPSEIKETLAGPLLRTHAKESQKAFRPDDHAREKQETLSRYKAEISKTQSFAGALGLVFPGGLSNPL